MSNGQVHPSFTKVLGTNKESNNEVMSMLSLSEYFRSLSYVSVRVRSLANPCDFEFQHVLNLTRSDWLYMIPGGDFPVGVGT